MRIAIFGSGYVGLVTGACLADGGHHVTLMDIDSQRIETLRAGRCPLWEPGLEEILRSNTAQGRLEFTDDTEQALRGAEVAFIAVGTPQAADGQADLRAVEAVARSIGRTAQSTLLVATKSTVPVGTAQRIQGLIDEQLRARPRAQRGGVVPRLHHTGYPHITVCSTPEFLKEGSAVADFKHGQRVVIGVSCARDEQLMRRVYEPFNRQHEKIIVMDVPSAELTKYAANALLATKISFMNEMAAVAERTGADIEKVRVGIGSDSRIGYQFLYAGAGFGGSCFPKDVQALAHTARELGVPTRVVEAVGAVNVRQRQLLFAKLSQLLGGPVNLRGATVAVWGLAFKPKTDDVREAPSLDLVRALLRAGATVRAYDPVAREMFRAALGAVDPEPGNATPLGRLVLCDAAFDALAGADALAVCTEWEEFRAFDAELLASRMRGRAIADGRNLWDPQEVAAAGFAYASVGRATTGMVQPAAADPRKATPITVDPTTSEPRTADPLTAASPATPASAMPGPPTIREAAERAPQ